MVLCEDWRLYVFRRGFNLLTKFPFDSKYSVGMHYLENSDTLLLLGVDCKDNTANIINYSRSRNIDLCCHSIYEILSDLLSNWNGELKYQDEHSISKAFL